MTQALDHFWDPIFNPKHTMSAEMLDLTLDTWAQDWNTPTQYIPDLKWQDIDEAIRHMRSGSSAGPGGWRPQELKSLPKQAIKELTLLFGLFEKEGFPHCLREIWIAILAKTSGEQMPRADSIRPISLASAVYRVYSRARALTLAAATETFLLDQQWGGRPRRGVYQPLAQVAAHIQSAHMGGPHIYGISVDFTKFYDTLPVSALECVLAHAGADEGMAKRVAAVLRGMRRRWKLPGRVLTPFLQTTHGLAQGCALSVLISNVFASFLLRRALRQEPSIITSAYCDDILLISPTMEALERVWTSFKLAADILGLRLNTKKTFCFATDPRQRAEWQSGVGLDGLMVKHEFKYLGALLHTRPNNANAMEAVQQAKHYQDIATARLTKIKQLPLTVEQRGVVATSTIMAVINYAPWGWRWTTSQMTSLKTSLVTATQGGRVPKMHSSREIFFAYFHKLHLLDPASALATSAMKWLAVWWQMAPVVVQASYDNQAPGILAQLFQHVQHMGVKQEGPVQWSTHDGREFDLQHQLAQHGRAVVWHNWREFVRWHWMRSLELRRPAFQGASAADRSTSLKLYRKISVPMDRGTFRILLMDALPTRVRWYREDDQQRCPTCHVRHDTHHLLWECRGNEHLRRIPWQAVQQLPRCLTHCGILVKGCPILHHQVQQQLVEIAKHYMTHMDRAPRPRGAQRAPDDQPVQSGIPIRRIPCKRSPDTIPMMPPRPHLGQWHLNGHTGRCIRSKGTWRVQCQLCMRTCEWRKRALLGPCTNAPKGQRVQPADGFQKAWVHKQAYIQCEACGARALWATKNRFQRSHRCRRDPHGATVRHLSFADKEKNMTQQGFERHTIQCVETGQWSCVICGSTTKRAQSLRQTWCRWPEGASRYLYR